MDTDEKCRAVMEQKDSKGKQCWRPALENGYCGKHQKQAILEKEKAEGKKKCFTHRCIQMLPGDSKEKYCEICILKKKEIKKEIKLCKAFKQQGENKGQACGLKATDGDYCGKHAKRQKLIEEAEAKKIRICDDGKRACKNPTSNNQLKCDKCLAKNREIENAIYVSRQLDNTKCLGCGISIENTNKGHRGNTVQQCKKCYEKQREIEEKRNHENKRDYNQERQKNIERHMNEYIDSAGKRGIPFRLTTEEFIKMVSNACVYCGYKSETVIGIDRIFSERGYTIENTVSCCSKCNTVKGKMTPSEIMEHVLKMGSYMLQNKESLEKEKKYKNTNETENGKSWLRPSEITRIVLDGRLKDFIEDCKMDKRSPAFIQKMEDLAEKKMPHHETLAYVKNALRTESNKEKRNTNNTRQRINREELFGFLELKAPEKFIEHYESAHGKQEGLIDEVTSLLISWTSDLSKEEKCELLGKSLTRLQNKRNRI